ncbi:MAG: hypothetical protein RIQ60_1909 [Pseudomonadota bacterium]|jgi:hypothetical protein
MMGRPGWHAKTGSCLRLDVRRMHRDGCLVDGNAGAWQWRNDEGQPLATIGYAVRAGELVLSYAVNGQPMEQRPAILRTGCTYGGDRPWFGCPRCGSRVALLYLRVSAGFICRQCARLVYASQSESVTGRTWRKQRRLESLLLPDGAKPPGMHWATFERIRAAINECEARRDAELVGWAVRRFPGLLRG